MQNNQTNNFEINFTPLTDWRTFLRNAMSTSAPLTIFAVVMLVSFIATMIGALVDPKVITSAPAWFKPAKFSISFIFYSLTLPLFIKHKVSFEEAATVFGNPLSETFDDPDHSAEELRFLIIGYSEKGKLLFVSHTDDRETVRIISARESTRTERESYKQEQN